MENQYAEKDFDIEVNRSFEKKGEAVRIIGKCLIALIIIMGLSGFFGFGLWTKKNKSVSEFINIEYECFLHASKETPLKIYVKQEQTHDSIINIRISGAYFNKVSLKSILPEPLATTIRNNAMVFIFKSSNLGSGCITFNTLPVKAGNVNFEATIEEESVMFNQFIYP